MQTHKLTQGSPEWHAHRRQYFNASDAPAMMGCSPYETRDQLIHRLATGITPEVDAMTQRRFDDGHRFEALARPLAEAIIGEDLYPVVATEGKLSASSDGLTADDRINFEHKSLNEELRVIMVEGCTGAELPLYHRVQQEQQHIVFKAEKTLFMASKWNGDTLVEERHCWYTPDPALAAAIAAGWLQLEKDVAAYVPPAAAAPTPTGRAPETLPALLITVRGEVTDSNLASFKEVALAAIRSVNRDLKTDQDFADANKAVGWCADIEDRVDGAKQHALSQTATIDALFKTMDDIKAEARQVRLDLEKLVKARSVSLKTELLTEAQTALSEFLRAKNTAIGRDYMPHVTADFAGAIHGKKNFDSMRAALNSALANAKIEASAIADKIMANMKVLQELGSAHKFLFLDTKDIVLKQTDDLTALVKTRIAEHDKAEADKLEKQREQIRLEEVAKLVRRQEIQTRIDVFATVGEPLENREILELYSILTTIKSSLITATHFDGRVQDGLDAKAAAEKRVLAAIESATSKLPPAIDAEVAPAASAPAMDPAMAQVREVVRQATPAIVATAAPAVIPMVRPAARPAAPATPPSLKLGDINALLSPITLTADGLTSLGFAPAAVDRSAKMYHASDLTNMCAALHDLLGRVQAKQAA